jgi:hypoxanthine phosphoribosyltransferase
MSSASNVPILSPTTNSEQLRRFREIKLELKKQDYPVEETRAFVNQYLQKVAPKLQGQINEKTLLVRVPSGSGTNMVTVLFQQALSDAFGAGALPGHLVMKLHKAEAKNNLHLEQRNEDPIRYRIDAAEIKAIAAKYTQVVIVDDVIGSGESSIRLKKEFEKAGIKVHALLSLVTVEKNYPKPGDIERVLKKFSDYLSLELPEVLALREVLKTAFSEYTRQKLNRFERRLQSVGSAKKLLDAAQQAAKLEREISIQIRNKNSQRL